MTKVTSLHQLHIGLKAKMAPFGGFDMPIQYTSVKDEVLAVRNKVGVFDVSHMGEFFCIGKDAVNFVDSIITNDFKNAETKKAVYSPLCREDGTMIDDLIAYKLGHEKVLICVNASNIDKDWTWIEKQFKSKNWDCTLTNNSEDYSLLAIQGPETESILKRLELFPAGDFSYYSAVEAKQNGMDLIFARTGYTGEDGVEVFGSHKDITTIWNKLMEAGVTPCGLASRDVLRLEVCFPLYGHELSDNWTPLDASLKWTVKLAKENFIGKEALTAYKPRYKLIKLLLDKGIPREGYIVRDHQLNEIGKVTSGTMSVVLGKGIALALVNADAKTDGESLLVSIRDNNYEAKIMKTAFVRGGHK
jgi:aminomethyltransferase